MTRTAGRCDRSIPLPGRECISQPGSPPGVIINTQANDDMKNLLNSTQVATVFLDRDLRVKRYTETAKDVIPLIEADVGRPISDLSINLDLGDLTRLCRGVLKTLVPVEMQARNGSGGRHLVRILPYRTADNAIDGAVITMIELPQRETGETSAVIGRDLYRSIVNTLREPVLVLDGDLRVLAANDSFCQAFDVSRKETHGELVYQLGDGQWDVPILRELLESVLPADEIITDFDVEHDFPRVGHKSFRLNARRMVVTGSTPSDLIFLAMEEIAGEGQ